MKKYFLVFILFFSVCIGFSQHEHHHQNVQPQKADSLKSKEVINQEIEKHNQPGGKTVVYHLYVADTLVNYTGKIKHAIAINGSIPAPTLIFTEGDTAEIYLHNMLKTETSLHWHGIILPNSEDGVPYLTTSKIPGGTTHLYKFPVVQNGTYWYHSHTRLQEQIGMYGALIFKKKNEAPMKEYIVVLSDWTNQKPGQVQRRLRNANDYFAIKKGSTQSYLEAIQQGHFKTKVENEWKRMLAMDVSDVYYERFLANGRQQDEASKFKSGNKVKLRVINGSASTYFWLNYAGGKITVVANDGEDVQPVEVDRLIIAVAETYDLVVTIPDDMSYEFLATSEDRTSSASVWLGKGHKMEVKSLPRLKYFEGMKMMNDMMKMNGDMDDMGMNMSLQQMDMNMVMYPEIMDESSSSDSMKNMEHHSHGKRGSEMVTLNYAMLKSVKKTTLPDAPTRTMHFLLTGNMNRYVWTINNKTVNEWDRILIKKGENIRIILTNNSMMRHPMHLHGHFFRVLNGQGEYAPLKNVLDIMPMETDTIEFAATESGDWFFHCHILYHMMAGMGNVFSYENSLPNLQLPDSKETFRDFKRDNRMVHTMAEIGLESNGSDGEVMLSTERFALKSEWHIGLNKHHGYESETYIGRYFGKMQWWFPYVGFDYRYRKPEHMDMEMEVERNLFGQEDSKGKRHSVVFGIQYLLPFLVTLNASIDTDGKLRLQLMREDMPLSSRLRLNWMVNTDKEYMIGMRYIITKTFSVSTHYDSDMGYGAGITITY